MATATHRSKIDVVEDSTQQKMRALGAHKSTAALLRYAKVVCPLRSPPRHLWTIAFASRHAFFEAEPFGRREVPDRVVVDLQAAAGKRGNEPV
jgi:hypothetical protein